MSCMLFMTFDQPSQQYYYTWACNTVPQWIFIITKVIKKVYWNISKILKIHFTANTGLVKYKQNKIYEKYLK